MKREYYFDSVEEAQMTSPQPQKKLTFEEWWEDAQHTVPFEEWPEKAIWLAAQENK